MRKLPERSKRRGVLAHCIAGLTVALEGWERFSAGAVPVGAVLLLLGAFLIAHGLLLSRLHKSRYNTHFEAGIFLVEATVFALIAAEFFERGKKLLPWLYIGLVVVYITLAAVRFMRSRSSVQS